MENNPSVKVLLTYHKPGQILKDDILTPIYLEESDYYERLKNGEIKEGDFPLVIKSYRELHPGTNFCIREFMAIYWAWKNYDKIGNPDYFGIMHYRRHFVLNDVSEIPASYKNGVVTFENMDEGYLSAIGYSKENLTNIMKEKDFICINPVDEGCSIYEHYSKHCILSDLDDCINIVDKKYPKFSNGLKEYLEQNKGYYCNIFIMKKELFFEYCEFIFGVLEEHAKNIDTKYRSSFDSMDYTTRVLSGFYFDNLMKQKNLKYKTYPVSMVKNMDNKKPEEIKPAFEKNNIPIVFTAETDYVQFVGVAMQSIMDNSSKERNYDIFLITDKISDHDKKILEEMVLDKPNYSLRFIDMKNYIRQDGYNTQLIYNGSRFSGATFYRLWIPIIFKNFDKVIYLDSDLVVLDDIANLYDIDLGDNILGGVKDTELIRGLYKDCTDSAFLHKYMPNILGLKNIYDYVQAGVLVFSIPVSIREKFFDKCFRKLEEIVRAYNNDQDLVNYAAQGKVCFLPNNWNIEWHTYLFDKRLNKTLPIQTYKDYIDALDNPKIIHYSSFFKPWKNPTLDRAQYFWKYARRTPFYEQIVYQFLRYNPTQEYENKGINVEKFKKVVPREVFSRHYKILSLIPLFTVSRTNFLPAKKEAIPLMLDEQTTDYLYKYKLFNLFKLLSMTKKNSNIYNKEENLYLFGLIPFYHRNVFSTMREGFLLGIPTIRKRLYNKTIEYTYFNMIKITRSINKNGQSSEKN